jgi:hypothetical protein
VAGLPIDNALKYESGLSLFKQNLMWIFSIALVGLTFWSLVKIYLDSIIRLVSCLYMALFELDLFSIDFTIYFFTARIVS